MVNNAATGAALGTAISPGLGTVIGAGLGGLSSVVGNLIGSSDNAKNRKYDQQKTYYLTQYDRDKTVWQNEQQWKMWNANNEYNSASAVAQRYRDAGLNPALMMGENSAGIASGMPSSSGGTPSTGGAPGAFVPNMAGFETAAQLLSEYFQNKEVKGAQAEKTAAEAEGQRIQNKYQESLTLRMMEKLYSEIGLTREQKRKLLLENGVTAYSLDALNQRADYQNQLLDAQVDQARTQSNLNSLDSMLAKINAKYLPEQFKAQIANFKANTYKATQEGILSAFQAAGINLDNQQKSMIMPFVRDIYHNNAKESSWKVLQTKYNRFPASPWGLGNTVLDMFVDGVFNKLGLSRDKTGFYK